ncbi:MAG: TRAP transporter small permease [Verrucomicrobiales bacterium]|nr:TRAP transporter small permease [Verrucomicrobiales bacterium]
MRRFWQHFEEIVGAALLLVLCGVTTLQVVSRYVLASPFSWTEEVATLVFGWLVFIGASLALKQNEHFVIEVGVDLLPPRARRIVRLLAMGLVMVAALILILFGMKLVLGSAYVKTAILGISKAWLYLSAPVGGLLLLLRAWERLAPIRADTESLHPEDRKPEAQP